MLSFFVWIVHATSDPFPFCDPNVSGDNLCEVRALVGCHFLNTKNPVVKDAMSNLEKGRSKKMSAKTLLTNRQPESSDSGSGTSLYASFLGAIDAEGSTSALIGMQTSFEIFVRFLYVEDGKFDQMKECLVVQQELGKEFEMGQLSGWVKKGSTLPECLKKREPYLSIENQYKSTFIPYQKSLREALCTSLPINTFWFDTQPKILLVRKETALETTGDHSGTIVCFVNCQFNSIAGKGLVRGTSLVETYAAVLEIYSENDPDFKTLVDSLFPGGISKLDKAECLSIFRKGIGFNSNLGLSIPVKSHWTIINGTGFFDGWYNSPTSTIDKGTNVKLF